jgi:fatty acid desaturase
MATLIGDLEKPQFLPVSSASTAPHLLDDIARMWRWARQQSVAGELTALYKPAPWRFLAAAIFDWLLIFGAFAAVVIGGFILIPVALIVIGNRQRALGNLMHDASHGSFAGDRWQADTLADCLLFLPLFTMLALYRREHFAHHRRLGSPGDDGDLIHCEEDMVRGWTSLLWRHMTSRRIWIGSVLGHLPRADAWARSGMFVWWGVVLLAIALILRPADAGLFAALWLASRATTFHLITVFREISNHVGLRPGTIIGFCRNHTAGGFLGALFHPHNDGYHLAHHLNPGIPFFALPQAHALLMYWPEYATAAHSHCYFVGRGTLVQSWVRRTPRLAAVGMQTSQSDD